MPVTLPIGINEKGVLAVYSILGNKKTLEWSSRMTILIDFCIW
jgi:hypothetical protein